MSSKTENKKDKNTADGSAPVDRLVRRPAFNNKDLSTYKKLPTQKEKAEFLLQFEIRASTNIIDLNLVNQAFIGKVGLPIHGVHYSDEEVINKAVEWLKNKAAA